MWVHDVSTGPAQPPPIGFPTRNNNNLAGFQSSAIAEEFQSHNWAMPSLDNDDPKADMDQIKSRHIKTKKAETTFASRKKRKMSDTDNSSSNDCEILPNVPKKKSKKHKKKSAKDKKAPNLAFQYFIYFATSEQMVVSNYRGKKAQSVLISSVFEDILAASQSERYALITDINQLVEHRQSNGKVDVIVILPDPRQVDLAQLLEHHCSRKVWNWMVSQIPYWIFSNQMKQLCALLVSNSNNYCLNIETHCEKFRFAWYAIGSAIFYFTPKTLPNLLLLGYDEFEKEYSGIICDSSQLDEIRLVVFDEKDQIGQKQKELFSKDFNAYLQKGKNKSMTQTKKERQQVQQFKKNYEDGPAKSESGDLDFDDEETEPSSRGDSNDGEEYSDDEGEESDDEDDDEYLPHESADAPKSNRRSTRLKTKRKSKLMKKERKASGKKARSKSTQGTNSSNKKSKDGKRGAYGKRKSQKNKYPLPQGQQFKTRALSDYKLADINATVHLKENGKDFLRSLSVESHTCSDEISKIDSKLKWFDIPDYKYPAPEDTKGIAYRSFKPPNGLRITFRQKLDLLEQDENLLNEIKKYFAQKANLTVSEDSSLSPMTENVENKQSEELEEERMEKKQMEQERLKKEKLEKERLKKEQMEKEQLKKEEMEKERLKKEELDKQRLKKEQMEKELLTKEQMEKERLKKEQMEKEQLKQDGMDKERLKQEELEKQRLKKEQMEKERLKKQQMEKERLAKEELEKERLKQEELEKQRLKKQQMEAERLKSEQLAEHKERELEEKKKVISSEKKQQESPKATMIIVCNVNQNEKFIEVKMQQAVRDLFGKKSQETVDLESDEKHHELTQKLKELVNLSIEDALKPEYHGALQVIFGKAAVEKVVQTQKGN